MGKLNAKGIKFLAVITQYTQGIAVHGFLHIRSFPCQFACQLLRKHFDYKEKYTINPAEVDCKVSMTCFSSQSIAPLVHPGEDFPKAGTYKLHSQPSKKRLKILIISQSFVVM